MEKMRVLEVGIAKIHMLRWRTNITQKSRIQNEDLSLGVLNIKNKMRENCLSWFDHMHEGQKVH